MKAPREMKLAKCSNYEECGKSEPTTMMDATGLWFMAVCLNCGQAGPLAHTEEGAVAGWNAEQKAKAKRRAYRRGYGR